MTARAPKKQSPPQPPALPDGDTLRPTPDLLAEPGELDVYQALVTGDHTGLTAGGEIAASVFDGADLSGTRFEPLSLSNTAIRRGDLSNAVWAKMTARRTEITACRAVGWRVYLDLAEDLLVEDCRWELGSLHLARSRGPVVFRNCGFDGTAIRGDLSGAVFDNCSLAGAEFAADKAAGCDLRTSRLDGARGLASLRGSEITAAQAVELAGVLAAELGFRVS